MRSLKALEVWIKSEIGGSFIKWKNLLRIGGFRAVSFIEQATDQ